MDQSFWNLNHACTKFHTERWRSSTCWITIHFYQILIVRIERTTNCFDENACLYINWQNIDYFFLWNFINKFKGDCLSSTRNLSVKVIFNHVIKLKQYCAVFSKSINDKSDQEFSCLFIHYSIIFVIISLY